MKVISKYKDYYDYLAGVYGMDERLVLDRTNFGTPLYTDFVNFYICGKQIDAYFDSTENKFYFGEDLKIKFPKKEIKKSRWGITWLNERDDNYIYLNSNKVRYGAKISTVIIEDKKKLNEKLGCPILCNTIGVTYNSAPAYTLFPKLDETGIAKILPPHDIYMMLCEWLGKEKEIIDKRNDEEKLLSAGFDKKISFRNVK